MAERIVEFEGRMEIPHRNKNSQEHRPLWWGGSCETELSFPGGIKKGHGSWDDHPDFHDLDVILDGEDLPKVNPTRRFEVLALL